MGFESLETKEGMLSVFEYVSVLTPGVLKERHDQHIPRGSQRKHPRAQRL